MSAWLSACGPSPASPTRRLDVGSESLPPQAYAAALAARPIGPPKLAMLLGRRSPEEAWEHAGDRSVDVGALWREYVERGIGVHVLGQPGYPAALAGDHEAPAVL